MNIYLEKYDVSFNIKKITFYISSRHQRAQVIGQGRWTVASP
jgi:hypothetical protein